MNLNGIFYVFCCRRSLDVTNPKSCHVCDVILIRGSTWIVEVSVQERMSTLFLIPEICFWVYWLILLIHCIRTRLNKNQSSPLVKHLLNQWNQTKETNKWKTFPLHFPINKKKKNSLSLIYVFDRFPTLFFQYADINKDKYDILLRPHGNVIVERRRMCGA